YKIALDNGLDYRELAAWNGIENVNVIREGQTLRLAPPGEATAPAAAGVTTMPLRTAPPVTTADAKPPPSASATPPAAAGTRNSDNYKPQPKPLKEPYSEQAVRDIQKAAPAMPPPAPAAPEPPPVVAKAEPPKAPAPPEAKPAPAPATES